MTFMSSFGRSADLTQADPVQPMAPGLRSSEQSQRTPLIEIKRPAFVGAQRYFDTSAAFEGRLLKEARERTDAVPRLRLWTDDYSDLYRILK